jgi:hypothetical protein
MSPCFEKRKPTHARSHFEVVIVQRRRAATFPGGRVTPAHEGLPTSEQWGTAGWPCSDLAGAEARFARLVAERQDGPRAPQTTLENASQPGGGCPDTGAAFGRADLAPLQAHRAAPSRRLDRRHAWRER